ncbi:hypothetical protein [uncultured Christiangramia sp.]|uniref:hypothetical protein n=1 Tax=Christiangramia sp. 3-2217-3z TaxID=3417564 RepID=UPI0026056F48|nr:hypothetical protein [uncultured Christiangramia sp.]
MTSNFDRILSRLDAFVRKYYFSQILKGMMLFAGIGLLYFLLTASLEHLFWFSESVRAFLFWLFISIEIILFIYFIGFPLLKLFKLRKGINKEQASEIIGTHFQEIGDRLLNLLQLDRTSERSELLIASIDQKAESLKIFNFSEAIELKKNLKFLPVVILPVLIILALWISNNSHVFTDGFDRISNYDQVYEQPAPFQFIILNDKLETFQNSDFELVVQIEGDQIPEELHLITDDYKRILTTEGHGRFVYKFENVDNSLNFRLIGAGISSRTYKLKVLALPLITNMDVEVNYPNYLNLDDQVFKGIGSFQVPEGSKLSWNFSTVATDFVQFESNDSVRNLPVSQQQAEIEQQIFRDFNYSVSSSNANKTDHEKLDFLIEVVRDLNPEISLQHTKDSLDSQNTYIKGRVEDDHGLSSLQLVYYPQDSIQKKRIQKLDVSSALVDEFYYSFPNELDLEPGISYSYYFEVFDNDGVNGAKSCRSEILNFRKITQTEKEDQNLEKQQNSIETFSEELEEFRKDANELEELQRINKENRNLNYNEKQRLDQFLERQKIQNKLMQKHSKELQQSIEEQSNEQPSSSKEDLQKRLDENENSLKENEELLKELQEYTHKIEVENLGEKLEDLAKKNKNNERNLEQLLELTKRYYIEEKRRKIARDLNRLADEQEKISNESKSTSEEQKNLNNEFDRIQQQMDALSKDNQQLKKPKSLARYEAIEKEISEDQKKASEKLQQQKNASQEQKNAAKKMRRLSAKMQQSGMQADMQKLEADAKVLREILNNLVKFSLIQEELLEDFKSIKQTSPAYANKLNEQSELRENFEHIDDSIYSLALQNPMFSSKITSKLTDIDFDIEKSLERLAEIQIGQGTASQQYVVTGANDLAVMLSDILDSMQDMMSSPQSGSGDGQEFQLQQIIDEQKELQQDMQQNMDIPEKSGKPDQQNSGEIFEIYKRQQNIRRKLNEIMDNDSSNALEKKMQQIEEDLLEKGLDGKTLERMKQLDYELMKMKSAAQKQGFDNKRKANMNTLIYENRLQNQINTAKEYFHSTEILNRQVLPLQQIYRSKVKEYFGKRND